MQMDFSEFHKGVYNTYKENTAKFNEGSTQMEGIMFFLVFTF